MPPLLFGCLCLLAGNSSKIKASIEEVLWNQCSFFSETSCSSVRSASYSHFCFTLQAHVWRQKFNLCKDFVLVMRCFARNIMFFYAATFVWMFIFFVFTCFMWVTRPGLHFLTVQNNLRHHSVYCLQTHHLHTVHCQKIVSDHDNDTILHAATTRRRITIWVNQESLGAIRESKHQI